MIEKQKSISTLERAVAGGDYGPQPLDALMTSHALSNHALVDAAKEHLTHKMIAKARRGRRLSRKVQLKILDAFNLAAPAPKTDEDPSCYLFQDLFNYDGR